MKLLFDGIPISVQHSHYDEIARNASEGDSAFSLIIDGKEYYFQQQHFGDFALIYPEHHDKIPGKNWIDGV